MVHPFQLLDPPIFRVYCVWEVIQLTRIIFVFHKSKKRCTYLYSYLMNETSDFEDWVVIVVMVADI